MIADTDGDLGQIYTVMKINMDNHLPIVLRLYWTPLHKGKLAQEAVRDVLEARIIEHSTSLGRALNKIIKLLAYPALLINGMLALQWNSAGVLKSVVVIIIRSKWIISKGY